MANGRVVSVVKGFWPKLNSLHTVWEVDDDKRCSGVKGSVESCKNFKSGKCLNVVASVEMSG